MAAQLESFLREGAFEKQMRDRTGRRSFRGQTEGAAEPSGPFFYIGLGVFLQLGENLPRIRILPLGQAIVHVKFRRREEALLVNAAFASGRW